MLVLKALARGAKHGYAVAEWIHESSNDVLHTWEEGRCIRRYTGWNCAGCCRRMGQFGE